VGMVRTVDRANFLIRQLAELGAQQTASARLCEVHTLWVVGNSELIAKVTVSALPDL